MGQVCSAVCDRPAGTGTKRTGGHSAAGGGSGFAYGANIEKQRLLYAEPGMKPPSYKVLLLGPAGAGKSTVVKHLRHLYGKKLSDEERRTYVPEIHPFVLRTAKMAVFAVEGRDPRGETRQVVRSVALQRTSTMIMRNLSVDSYRSFPSDDDDSPRDGVPTGFEHPGAAHSAGSASASTSASSRGSADERSGDEADDEEEDVTQRGFRGAALEAAELVKMTGLEDPLDEVLGSALTALWNDVAFRQAFNETDTWDSHSQCAHFLDDIGRVAVAQYLPTMEDVFCSYHATTGIVRHGLRTAEAAFKLVDTGGRLTERRKWARAFYKTDVVVFVASLACVDQLVVDGTKRGEEPINAMTDALELWRGTIQSDALYECPVVLALTQRDVLQEKVREGRLRMHLCPEFSEFAGLEAADAEAAEDAIVSAFERIWREQHRGLAVGRDQRRLAVCVGNMHDENDVRELFEELCSLLDDPTRM